MLMFGFKKKTLPSTIFIENTDVIADNQQSVTSVWQQRHAQSNIGLILAKSIVMPYEPLDAALADYVRIHGLSTPLHEPYFSMTFTEQSGGVSGNIWHHGAEYQVTLKGNPEQVLNLCDLSENERESLTLQLHTMSATGIDVVALAEGLFSRPIKKPSELNRDEKFTFVGFVGVQLAVSGEARQLIAMAKSHAMRIYLCTGKHQSVGYFLGEQLGIIHTPSDVCDVRTIDTTGMALTQTVFSCCSAQHKKQILLALKSIDDTVQIIATSDDIKKLLAK